MKTSDWIALLAAGLFFAAPAWADAGRIVGHLEGISQDGDHFFISGWAAQQGQKKSIAVHVFAEDQSDPSKRNLIIIQWANLYSEPAVNQQCQDHEGGKHRFLIMLPHGYGPQSTLYVNGIRVVDGVPNDEIAGSGERLVRLPVLDAPHPALPTPAGAYHHLAGHPRVFMTEAELKDLVARINHPASYSQQRFGQLANQIRHDLTSGIDWDWTYSGCDGELYMYFFSYEPQNHLDAEIRAAVHVAPNFKYPMGGAVVASRLALYATLVKAGAAMPPDAPSADDAARLAKRILLAWADRGFPRDAQGRILPLVSESCGPTAKAPTMVQPRDTGALGLGRGVLYSVQAQDLLQSFGALNADEETRLDTFHGAMFELIRQSDNAFFGQRVYPYPDAARYNNIVANALASLLATARLLDDSHKLNAVLYGGDRSIPVLNSWIRAFDRLIYGEADSLPEFGGNRYSDSLTSLKNHSDFQLPTVVPGEIADRGRNATPLQGIGYPMFTLERLIDGAEILRIAGFDPYGYRGVHKQSIEMALEYYSRYAKSAGFYKVVTAENSGSIPNAAQYYGKIVNGVDQLIPIGACRFPGKTTIMELEAEAKLRSSTGAFSLDAILFGKWRD